MSIFYQRVRNFQVYYWFSRKTKKPITSTPSKTRSFYIAKNRELIWRASHAVFPLSAYRANHRSRWFLRPHPCCPRSHGAGAFLPSVRYAPDASSNPKDCDQPKVAWASSTQSVRPAPLRAPGPPSLRGPWMHARAGSEAFDQGYISLVRITSSISPRTYGGTFRSCPATCATEAVYTNRRHTTRCPLKLTR